MSLPGFELQPGQDLGAYIDRAIFGEAHLWRFTLTWDPEGLLSTLPAIVTGLCGTLTGYWLRSKHDGRIKLLGLLLFGCLGIVVGAAWGRIFPINKYLWTSSYAVYTAGFALIFMGACYWLFDLHQARVTWAQPFLWLGMNPLFAYVGAQIGVIALGTLYIGTVEQHIHLGTVIQKSLFGEHWDVIGQTAWRDPSWPMLYWTVLYTIFWTLSTGLLYRKSIFFKA